MYGLTTWENSYRIIQQKKRRNNARGIFWTDDHDLIKKLKFNITKNLPKIQLTRCSKVETSAITEKNIIESDNGSNNPKKSINSEIAHSIPTLTFSGAGLKMSKFDEVANLKSMIDELAEYDEETDTTDKVVTKHSNDLENDHENPNVFVEDSDTCDDREDSDHKRTNQIINDESDYEIEPVTESGDMDQDIKKSKDKEIDAGKSGCPNATYSKHIRQHDCIDGTSTNFSTTIVTNEVITENLEDDRNNNYSRDKNSDAGTIERTDVTCPEHSYTDDHISIATNVWKAIVTDEVEIEHSNYLENDHEKPNVCVKDSNTCDDREDSDHEPTNQIINDESDYEIEPVTESGDMDQDVKKSKDKETDADQYIDCLQSNSSIQPIIEDDKDCNVVDTSILRNTTDLKNDNTDLLLTDAEKEYFKNLECELYDDSDTSDSDSDLEYDDDNVTCKDMSNADENKHEQTDKSETVRDSFSEIQNADFNLSYVLNFPVDDLNSSNVNINLTDHSFLNLDISNKSLFGNISFNNDILSEINPLDNQKNQETVYIPQDSIIYVNETDSSIHHEQVENHNRNSSSLEFCENFVKIPTPIQTVDSQKTSNTVEKEYTSSNCQASSSGEPIPHDTVAVPLPKTSPQKKEKKIISTADEVKYYYCRWCDKYIQKFGRHIQESHKDKPEVKELFEPELSLTKKRNMIGKIMKEHMFFHNYEKPDSKDKKGYLVVRRPNRNMKNKSTLSSDDFIACDECHKILRVSNIRHHYSHCQKNESSTNRGRLADSRRLVTRLHPYANESMKNKILPYMHDDKYKKKIINDELVILYGNNLTEKYSKQEDQSHIRSKLRNIGKFLWEAEQLDPKLKNLAMLAEPKNIKICVKATYAVCGANDELTEMRAPGTAKAIGSVLKSVGEYLRRLYIERQQDDKKKLIKDFLKLIEGEFEIINRRAENVYREKRRLKEYNIPSMSDIHILQNYLEEINQKSYNNLLREFNYEDWIKLGETLLLLIQLFNRRRQGEMSKTKIKSFMSYKGIDENSDIMNTLSESEKANAKSYVRFVVNAKRDNDGVVLMKKQQVEYLELFLKYRSMAGVLDTNPYVFGLPPTDGRRDRYMQAYMLLAKYAPQSGAENPKTLRGTTLRKHLATTCANKNLTDSEVGDVARHLGHSELIHRSHYRDPAARDIVHVSQILESAIKPKNKEQSNLSLEFDQSSENSMTDVNTSADLSVVEESHVQLSKYQKSSQKSKKKSKCNGKPQKRKMITKDSTIDSSTPKKAKITRTRWSPNETDLINEYFGEYIKSRKYPSRLEIQEFITENNLILRNRTSAQLTTWFSNLYKKRNQNKK